MYDVRFHSPLIMFHTCSMKLTLQLCGGKNFAMNAWLSNWNFIAFERCAERLSMTTIVDLSLHFSFSRCMKGRNVSAVLLPAKASAWINPLWMLNAPIIVML